MKEITGNLLDIQKGILVHGCNCQGVMGSGVALAVKNKYKGTHTIYREVWRSVGLSLGSVILCAGLNYGSKNEHRPYEAHVSDELPDDLFVVHAMTQFAYGTDKRHVDYDAISACFAQVKLLARDFKLPVYYPLIGAGLGGGDWSEIAPRIDQALGEVEHYLVRLP